MMRMGIGMGIRMGMMDSIEVGKRLKRVIVVNTWMTMMS